ncbi:MAG: TadE/TadG family type IV pilus assembly protein [Telluria sp.]
MEPGRRYSLRHAQGGAVAVEAAICMTFVLVPLFALIFAFGNFFWYYTAVQKAVHDAALYMSGAPLAEIKSKASDALASEILAQETADFHLVTTIESSVECGYKVGNSTFVVYARCNTTNTPVSVQAMTSLTVPQPFFFALMGKARMNIIVFSQMPYVGR